MLERGREAEGFEFLERYRGQSFLSMLAEKDLVLTADLPESLASERLRLRHLYEKNRHALEELGPVPGEDPELLRLVAERRALAVERQRIWESVRRIAPRLASRRGPRPARPGEAARSLPKKTALLSFAVDREVGYVQVLRRDQDGDPRLSSAVLAVGADELRARVEAFRLLLRSPSRDSRHLASLTRRGSDLYRLLVAPVAPALAGAEEIVILPDGPLHGLPFAALVAARESPESGRPVFLVERFALRMAASAGELSVPEQRDAPVREAEGVRVAAFGDPWLKPSAVTGPVASLAPNARLTRAAELGPLPFARLEVEMIADLFPRAETRVGREATEGRVKRLAENLEIVHFACHSVIDERFPLDSYLALSPDAPVAQAGDDGLLQAWEIFEEVRLEADLVTLSACDTGLAGEGLVGLTQAFHYAGARSVLASLWRVSDRSSAQLMVRFYRQLKTGLGSSRALRAAQLELLAGLPPLAPQPKPGLGGFFSRFWPASSVPASDESLDTTHPYHWAAFQLYNSSG